MRSPHITAVVSWFPAAPSADVRAGSPPHAQGANIPTYSAALGTTDETTKRWLDPRTGHRRWGTVRTIGDFTAGGDGVRMRAHWRGQASIVSISGDIDAVNGPRVQDFVARLIPTGNALVLDLRGVNFIAAQGISVLIAVVEGCRTAAVPWSLVGSGVVNRILRLTVCDTVLPTASSIPEALRQISAPRGIPRFNAGGDDGAASCGMTASAGPEPTALRQAPAFAVEMAPRCLGDDRADGHRCAAAIDTLAETVWLARPGPRLVTSETRMRVDAIEARYEPRDLTSCRPSEPSDGDGKMEVSQW